MTTVDALFSLHTLVSVLIVLPALVLLYYNLEASDYEGNFDA
jgi:hypothetical protein